MLEASWSYIGRYRKIGFDHNDIANLFQENLGMGLRRFHKKMNEIDEKISALMATRHMLNDDIILMERGIANKGEIFEKTCRAFYYILPFPNRRCQRNGSRSAHFFLD